MTAGRVNHTQFAASPRDDGNGAPRPWPPRLYDAPEAQQAHAWRQLWAALCINSREELLAAGHLTGRTAAEVAVAVVNGLAARREAEAELDINDRKVLQRLMAEAQAQLACPGLAPTWANAYEQFLASVDRLDAMWARVQVPYTPPVDKN